LNYAKSRSDGKWHAIGVDNWNAPILNPQHETDNEKRSGMMNIAERTGGGGESTRTKSRLWENSGLKE